MDSLKALFKPLQPAIRPRDSHIIYYKERTPKDPIGDYVYCYWQLKSLQPLQETYMYRVVSDGCVDILIEVSSKTPFITGFSKKYITFDLGTSFHYLGIRFYPFMFPLLFNIPAKTVVDQFLPLEDILPELGMGMGMQSMSMEDSLEQVANHFDRVLSPYTQDLPQHDPRLSKTINQILLSGGNIQIKDMDIDMSERQLRRMFQFYFGESPKVFAKVYRFQRLLNSYLSTEGSLHEKVFYDMGYYDQAHFIKDFKRFYGVTPAQAFLRD